MKDLTNLNNEQLAEALRNGDQQAFETIYRRYKDELLTYAIRLTSNDDAAEDLVQEAFLRLATYDRPIQHLRGFLYKTMANLVVNWKVREYRRYTVPLCPTVPRRYEDNYTDDNHQLTEPVDEKAKYPHEIACQHEDVDRLMAAIQQLPAAQQAVIRAVCFEELTREQAAEQLKMPVGTVKVYSRRAVANLQDRLTDNRAQGAVDKE
jgi:RNA polymerase sigma-70 factor, ECF subfamily